SLTKNQNMVFEPDPKIPPSNLDRKKCERIVTNLISNAINYTDSGKQITLRTTFDARSLILSVQDEGIGIASEDLPHIFERFYRSPQAKNVNGMGTGLGLAIVKEMVAAQGGTINVETEVGKGSTFIVHLPIMQ